MAVLIIINQDRFKMMQLFPSLMSIGYEGHKSHRTRVTVQPALGNS